MWAIWFKNYSQCEIEQTTTKNKTHKTVLPIPL